MGAGASRPAHRSLNCRVATVVEFVNDTEHDVETLWLGYDGGERRYYTLRPGQRVRQPTFTAHPWAFRHPDAPDLPLAVNSQPVFYAPPLPAADAQAVEARVTAVAAVPWSTATHVAFPSDFRAQTAALLLCHHRLAEGQHAGDGAGAQPGCFLRRLGRRLSGQLAAVGLPCTATGTAMDAQQWCCLGDVPKELLLEVVAAAAPFVPLLVKPALPHGVQTEELPSRAHQLFRWGAGSGGQAMQAGAVAAHAGPAEPLQ